MALGQGCLMQRNLILLSCIKHPYIFFLHYKCLVFRTEGITVFILNIEDYGSNRKLYQFQNMKQFSMISTKPELTMSS